MAAYAYYRAAGKAPEAIASAERYVVLHPGISGAAARASHHRVVLPLTVHYDPRARTAIRRRTRSGARSTENEVALSRQRVCEQCRQSHSASGRQSRRLRNGGFSRYLKRKNYVASINRFKAVVTEYQTTAHRRGSAGASDLNAKHGARHRWRERRRRFGQLSGQQVVQR